MIQACLQCCFSVIQFTVHGVLGAVALGMKWPGRDASSAKINNAWNYTCTPP